LETDMTASTPESGWLTLPPRQSRLHWLPAGTLVVVTEGRLTLQHPPRWLAGETVRLRHVLTEGHAQPLETTGWWGLHADNAAGARLRLQVPATAVARWSAALGRARRWLLAALPLRGTSQG
jgi:hypothetical protein